VAAISLEGVGKIFPNGHAAVRDATLAIGDGELLVLVGPSGCGKSTVLRLIAGLEAPSGGRIAIGDRDVTDVPPQQRDLAMVFQSYALYPHKSVRDNLAFALQVRQMPAAQIEERVRATAASLGIASLPQRQKHTRYPSTLAPPRRHLRTTLQRRPRPETPASGAQALTKAVDGST
jgi:multiple sugar transport system ATP-binding protein